MEQPILLIVALVVGLVLGGGAVWFFTSNSATDLRERLDTRESEFKELDAKYLRTFADLEAAKESTKRIEPLERELADIRAENTTFRAERASFAEQKKLLEESRDKLLKEFENTGAQVLSKAQEAFLRRADERFKQSEEAGEQKIKALLSPVEETLGRYEKNLAEVEKDRVGSYRELRSAVELLNRSNVGVEKEARRLADVMSASPKLRGQWGEQQLKRILESAGLREGIDFVKEVSVETAAGIQRPDFVIQLPGEREMVVDVKCPLVSYKEAMTVEDDGERERLLDAHAKALRSYANDLGKKAYWQQFEKSPDFVILFVPGEHFLSAAAERDTSLIEDAFANNVIVASTINMLALAKLMAGMWRQETMAEKAREVHEIGRELYKRMLTMGGHLNKLGKNLETATNSYNAFVGSFEKKVITQAKRFEDLGVELPSDRLEATKTVDEGPNPLAKLIPEDNQEVAE